MERAPHTNSTPIVRIHALWPVVLLLAFVLSACDFGSGADTIGVDLSRVDSVQQLQPEPETSAWPALRAAVGAMVSPKETYTSYRLLMEYVSDRLDRELEFVQRKTYAEVNELFLEGGLDLAFICSGPFAHGRDKYGFEAVATPVVRGEPFYHSYLIVHRTSEARNLKDLRGGTFAFTDPHSNTGALVPSSWLQAMGERPETFFTRVIFTYSHDNSIMAVSRGLVDGATVDSHIWEYYDALDPEHTSKTRIIHRSEPFGSPPVVVSRDLPPALRASIQDTLLTMHEDPVGRNILDGLLIDRFVVPEPEWYEPIGIMAKGLHHDLPTP
jgi:phosphonate transport system substrate-binding protein